MQQKSLARQLNQWIITISSALVMLLGLSVLAGIQLYQPSFIQIEPTYFNMSYDSALCFFIAGVGLFAIFIRRVYISRVIAVILIIMGLLVLYQSLLNIDFRLTEKLLFLRFPSAYVSSRKVPLTAASFILTGLLFWYAVRKKSSQHKIILLASWVGMLLPSMGFLSLFGYVIHVDSKYVEGWGILAPMAMDTAGGFIILGVGITSFAAYASHRVGTNLKKSSPILITVFVSLMSLIFWRILITDEKLTELSPTIAIIAIIKELGVAALVGFTVYFSQRAYYYAKASKRLVAFTKATLEASANGLFVIDSRERIVGSNRKVLEMWEVPTVMYSETNFDRIVDFAAERLKNKEEFAIIIAKLKDNPEISSTFEMYLKNGRIFEFYSFPEYLDGKIIGRVFSFHDITSHKQIENKLLYQATHDVLTGLANRFLLLDHIEQAIAHERRHQKCLAILFFDLDRFKPINDSLGHAVGDLLLKAVANRLKSCTRDGDTLARLGGDEFVLLALDIEEEKDTILVAERYIEALSLPYYVENHELHLTCSVGVSVYPKDGKDANTLLKNADIAMYRAKNSEFHFQFYTTQMQEQVATRLTVENELRYTLERNELLLFYQPIFDLRSRKTCAAEALVRWQHPVRGLINPDEFISIAEETGIIVDIGRWVLRSACKQINAWQKSGIFTGKICVNVSEKQLKQPDFHLEIARILREENIAPHSIELELTETALMFGDHITEMLQKLRNIGLVLAIDDFGTGYSNLSYLKHFPTDKLKIDKTFLKDIPHNTDDNAIILTIIAMAKILNLHILAEGIENEEQLKFLYTNGCDEVQGYYFSPPLTADQFEQSLLTIDSHMSTILEKSR